MATRYRRRSTRKSSRFAFEPIAEAFGPRGCRGPGTYGYVKDRQRGSHIIWRHREPPYRRVVVPDHKEVATGTLRAIVREAGLTVDEFRELI